MTGAGAVLVVGGYGLVGGQAARILRARHPDLPLVLAGRRPQRGRRLAAELGASVAAIDADSERPLASLPRHPRAVLAAASDPHDRLLRDAMRRGIPIADINRAGHAAVLDVAAYASTERPSAPVLLAGSWLSGLTALAAAAAVHDLPEPERVDVTVLVSSRDRIGDDAWGFSRRLVWPYHPMARGRRRTVHPLTGVRRVRCPDGRERPAARVATLEQITLPLTLGVPTVETRLATFDPAALWGLVALKRTGALKALEHPAARRLRSALLERSGPGDFAGLTVTARRAGREATVEFLDVRGQAHLNGVGAALAAERVAGLAGAELPPGISFSEQHARPEADLAALRQAGVVVRRTAPRPPGLQSVDPSRPLEAVLAPLEEDLSA
ncbi:MAG TPA: hypothetical protein VF715_04820 [Thermoleophilaceae bacterium]|jgi:hypothetical protein